MIAEQQPATEPVHAPPLPEYVFRRANKDDGGFIFKSWLKTIGKHASASEHSCGLFPSSKQMIATLMGRSVTIVAVSKSDGRLIGYVCAERKPRGNGIMIHMVYVRLILEPYWKPRGHGIATALVGEAARVLGVGTEHVVVTSISKKWTKDYSMRKRWEQATRLPFLLTIERLAKG